MSDESAMFIHLLMVQPGKQEAQIALLKQNIATGVRTLHRWKTTRLSAATDGAGGVIHSAWEAVATIEAMHGDSRMNVYFSKIAVLANAESIAGYRYL
jgi:hypothetical protein